MDLICKRCGAKITADNVNMERMVAKCLECNAVFSFADSFAYAGSLEEAYQKFNVVKPKRMQIETLGGDMKITRRWFSPVVFFLIPFCLLWNGFILVFGFGSFLAADQGGIGAFGLCLLPHLAVGLFLAYFALASLVNVTEIKINTGEFSTRHGPLPWLGNRRLAASDITQVYCKEKVRHRRRSTSVTYEVHAVTPANTTEKLLTGLNEPEEALFLEQEIERFLGIKDRPVPGELR
ncbi:MAG: hypothetical protein BroJett011_72880 [Chloroflexota bacterium]|nr:MAG: hypothetical protein BroJett011_72880 [Chloroflexota bacterium]